MRAFIKAMIPAAALAAVLLAAAASVSNAEQADAIGCDSEASVSCPGMRVCICPRGDFEPISEGCGGSTDYIEVIIKNWSNEPIPDIPWTDFWIGACDAQYELAYCVDHIVADSLTGQNGRTTFSGRIAAGGCIPEGGVWISCQGMTLLDPGCIAPICLDVVLVGPDINVDGLVNLSDMTFFGQAYNKALGEPGYDTCCDYNDDDSVSLSDFAYFGEQYQHRCW